MTEPKDAVSAILGASSALAGLLLVFIGFVYVRGDSYHSKTGDPFKIVAKIGIVPFLMALACTWLCTDWLMGNDYVLSWSVCLFKWSLALTALYGGAILLFFL